MVVAATLWCCSACSSAPAQENLDARRARALASFDAVVRADRATILQTRGDLEAVLAARPDDAPARVHFGWLLVLAARERPLAQARAVAEEGFREMDAAVAIAPDDPNVRLVRARSDAQMPLVLGRGPIAETDFAWLVAGARAAVSPTTWPATLRREVFFQAGALALKLRRAAAAVGLLEEAVNVPAALPADDDVQSMLALARRELSSQGHAEDPPPHQIPAPAP
jgi:hypothetical protein